jgi:cobyrinic acid a,c-diamide synthase
MKKGLTLGYRQAIAQLNTPMITHGSLIQGHEFHRSQTDTIPSQPIFQFQNPNTGQLTKGDGWSMANLHASYLHLHWVQAPASPIVFFNNVRHPKIN